MPTDFEEMIRKACEMAVVKESVLLEGYIAYYLLANNCSINDVVIVKRLGSNQTDWRLCLERKSEVDKLPIVYPPED